MDVPFTLGLVILTSTAALLVGLHALALPRATLAAAVTRTLTTLGAAMIFFGANVLVGMALVLAARGITGGFLPLYLAADETLVALSIGQALLFEWWRELSARGRRR